MCNKLQYKFKVRNLEMKSNLNEDSQQLEQKLTAHQITFNQHIHMDTRDDSKLNITPQTINT